MKSANSKLNHIVDSTGERELHTLTDGIVTAHGCTSLKEAEQLLAIHVHAWKGDKRRG